MGSSTFPTAQIVPMSQHPPTFIWSAHLGSLGAVPLALPSNPGTVSDPAYPHQACSWPSPSGQHLSAHAHPQGIAQCGDWVPRCPWQPCSWLGQWDKPYLPVPALTVPMQGARVPSALVPRIHQPTLCSDIAFPCILVSIFIVWK